MKIEMGESLMYSWLRHVEGCQIAQLNWKATTGSTNRGLDPFFQVLKEKYEITSKLDQFLKQTEIDLVGIKILEGSHQVFAVDIAFHEGGLNYANVVEKITKEMISSAFVLYTQFRVREGKIIFASPKVAEVLSSDLRHTVQDLQKTFQDHHFDYDFELLFNNDFKVRIIDSVVKKAKTVKDMSDLFIRALKMLGIFSASMGTTSFKETVDNTDDAEAEENTIENVDRPKISSEDVLALSFDDLISQYEQGNAKIGKLALLFFEELSSMGRLTELFDQHPDLTLRGFKLLQEIGPADKTADLKKVSSYNRYYKKIFVDGARRFLLCSQWYDSDFKIIQNVAKDLKLE